MAERNRNHRRSDQFLGHKWLRLCREERHHGRQFVRKHLRPAAIKAQEVLGLCRRLKKRAAKDHGADGRKPERERGDDAKISAAAAHAPKKIGVLVWTGSHATT